ncbi:bi-domain-containing oxidoreductase [Thalassospira lucentensis]|uniref:bi-domain-containing oxidoreductase n=1 Tax=Thalassospira lucentensis TaxID=168935 RepID=UPI003D2EC17D
MTDMKALFRFPGERKIALVDCPIPSPTKNAILVRTSYSLISPGTEFSQVKQTTASLLHKAWQRPDLVALTLRTLGSEGASRTLDRVNNRLNQPLPMGYCGSGVIHATGENADGFSVGQRVAIAGMGHANHAEWNTVPINLACPIPETVSDQKAAFTTLYALALHAMRQGETAIGDRIAIIGAGLIGQLVGEVARVAGAHVEIIEPDAFRRNSALQNGAHACFATSSDATANTFDAVYICAPAKGANRQIDAATRLCRDRALIVCTGDVAINAERPPLYAKEITIRQVRSYGPGRYDPGYEELGQDYPIGHVRWTIKRNMQAALHLMADGRLDPSPLITSEIAFTDIADHFAKGPGPDHLACIVRYDTASSQPAEQKPTKKTPIPSNVAIKLGLIGAGNYFGGNLLPVLNKREDIDIVSCCSQNGISAMALARKVPSAQAISSAQDVINDPHVNSIMITTRHDSHAELAAMALMAGKNIWLEKPIAVDHAGLEVFRDQNARTTGNSIFMLGHNRRYTPMSAALRASLPDGAKHFRYRVRFSPLPANHWLYHPGQGGRTLGEISHFIDLIQSLIGRDITEITCNWLDRKIGDSIWQLRFADGSTGEISYLLTNRRCAKEILEINAPGFDAKITGWRKLQINGRTVMRNWFGQDKGQKAAIDAFADAITSGSSHPLTPSLTDEITLMARILKAANS